MKKIKIWDFSEYRFTNVSLELVAKSYHSEVVKSQFENLDDFMECFKIDKEHKEYIENYNKEKHILVEINKHDNLWFFNIDGFGWIMHYGTKSELLDDIKNNKTSFNYNISVYDEQKTTIREVNDYHYMILDDFDNIIQVYDDFELAKSQAVELDLYKVITFKIIDTLELRKGEND